MRQVLFWIGPLPIFGFGTMLFVTFIVCTWLAARRGEKEGIPKQHMYDLVVWIIVSGLIGARIVYMIQYHVPIWDFYRIWEGGLVFYGSALGGVAGYVLYYWFVFRKHHLSTWQLADILAPSIALGLCLGRIGCYLNGCCYGHVACPDCWSAQLGHFPLSAPPRFSLVQAGLQTTAGFAVENPRDDPRSRITYIEPGSAAEQGGLRTGDIITAVADVPNQEKFLEVVGAPEQLDSLDKLLGYPGHRLLWTDENQHAAAWQYEYTDAASYQRALQAAETVVGPRQVNRYDRLWNTLIHNWPRGENNLALSVQHADGQREDLDFVPRTIGLYPTQLYETISMALLVLLLLAYEPFRRRKGELIVLLMICYAVHRFVNESLRNDTKPVAFDLTLSQNGSILILIAALVLLVLLLRRPKDAEATPATA